MRIQAALAAISASIVTVAFAAEPVPPETVLVKRGDTTVTAGDFMASIARLPEDQRITFRADLQRIVSTVSAIYVNRALAAEARADGVDKDPEVAARMKLAEEQLLAQLYMDRFEKTIKTPDYTARALEAYRADPARYAVPEKVKFRHILVSFQGRTKEEARRRAEEARAKLLAKESFMRTAREYSNDPTLRSNDGVLGLAPYSTFIPALAEAAKKSPVDAVSEIIESSEGYHVIIVLERRPATVIPFERVKKGLIEGEQAKYRKAVVDKKLAEMTHSTDITLYTDEMAKLQTQVDRDELRRMHEEEAEREAGAKKAAKGN
ncbi:MAG: peptidylprolyl isomerase [Usitatibacter sp.]